MMMLMRQLMTPMVEEEEDNYEIDDLGKANTERKNGDTDDANADNEEVVDMKNGDSDNADIDFPNYEDVDGSYDDITKANDTGTDTVEDTDSDIYDADYNVAGDAECLYHQGYQC